MVSQFPPVITLPFEQSTILIVDGIVSVAGVFPIAVTIRLNDKVVSALDVNLTYVVSTMLASLSIIE